MGIDRSNNEFQRPRNWYHPKYWEGIIREEFGHDDEQLLEIPAQQFFDHLKMLGAPPDAPSIKQFESALQGASVFHLLLVAQDIARKAAEKDEEREGVPTHQERPAQVWRYIRDYTDRYFRGIHTKDVPVTALVRDMENRQERHGDIATIVRNDFRGAPSEALIEHLVKRGGRKPTEHEKDPMGIPLSEHLADLMGEACPHLLGRCPLSTAELLHVLEPLDHTRKSIIELLKAEDFRHRRSNETLSVRTYTDNLEVTEGILMMRLRMGLPIVGAEQLTQQLDLSQALVSRDQGYNFYRLRTLAHALLHTTELTLPVGLFADQWSGLATRNGPMLDARSFETDADLRKRYTKEQARFRREMARRTGEDLVAFLIEFIRNEGFREPTPQWERRNDPDWQRIHALVHGTRND